MVSITLARDSGIVRRMGEGGKGRDGRSMRGKVGGFKGRNQEGETVIAD